MDRRNWIAAFKVVGAMRDRDAASGNKRAVWNAGLTACQQRLRQNWSSPDMARHAPYCQPLRPRRKAVGQHPPARVSRMGSRRRAATASGLIKMQRQVNWPCNLRATCSISSISRTRPLACQRRKQFPGLCKICAAPMVKLLAQPAAFVWPVLPIPQAAGTWDQHWATLRFWDRIWR